MGKRGLTKKKKIILAIVGVILLGGLVTLALFLCLPGFKVKQFASDIEINYKGSINTDDIRVCFGNFFACDDLAARVEGSVDSSQLGDYSVKYVYEHDGSSYTLDQKVAVKDLEAPKITIEGLDGQACPTGRLKNAKVSAIDNYDGDITDKIEYKIDGGNVIISATDAAGNTASETVPVEKIEDKEAPVITIEGAATVTVKQGEEYKDLGATATDNCDTKVDVVTEGEVKTDTVGTYKLTYKARDAAGNEASAERVVVVRSKASGDRIVYLTFDDGPSDYTAELLDILKKYGVKATFFVTGAGSDEMIKREYDEGHQIGLHTFTHTYSVVYKSDEAFMGDLRWIQNRVKDATGYESHLMRFPGGSSNTVSRNYSRGIMSRLVKTVANEGFHYFDWNVSSGDAGGATTSDAVYNNVVNSLKEGYSIVLQHDTKKFSIDAVERIIQYGMANGYTFERLEESSPGAHHGTNN